MTLLYFSVHRCVSAAHWIICSGLTSAGLICQVFYSDESDLNPPAEWNLHRRTQTISQHALCDDDNVMSLDYNLTWWISAEFRWDVWLTADFKESVKLLIILQIKTFLQTDVCYIQHYMMLTVRLYDFKCMTCTRSGVFLDCSVAALLLK